ncbi:hypothetical protein [Bathymodiolus japonicus methanotrophic gill symbiont]|uniref:hypothetical protein n=1 Tax=Bathymodiolus japonicus methanotrophic gill symbiont TaxID=113269 RepID=UPI003B830246
MIQHSCCVYLGNELAAYGFGNDHPFGPMRHHVFEQEFYRQSLQEKVDILPPQTIGQKVLELFHTHAYVEQVKQQSILGTGYPDQGDTPAFTGMYEAASFVAGTVCAAVDRIMRNEYQRAFIPIAGLHHARRNIAAGFCVFNDCGIAIEYLRQQYKIQRIAYTRCSSFSIPLPSNSYLHPAEQYFNDAVGPKRPKSLPIICFPDGIS